MSNVATGGPSIIRFGVFEADTRSGELRKGGVRVALQEQPFRVLLLLLHHAGEVVSRDELQRALWAGDTFVDFDHGVNVAIARLREALGDDSTRPRFIETLPKRGYRFVAPVTLDRTRVGLRPRARWTAVATVVLLAGGTALWQILSRHSRVLSERDTILVADFVNRTGDDVFDGTLKQGLTVQLEQTPYLTVISQERVRETLKQMIRSPDDRVVGSVAREICLRAGAKLSINGSVAALGNSYVLGLDAINCDSGETVANVQVEAADRKHILKALGTAASQMRPKLGESQATIRRFNVPLEGATTPSLEAFKAYAVANEVFFHGAMNPIPFFERAIELDPSFAMAHARLATAFGNRDLFDKAAPHIQQAYALRHQVSERERLYIEAHYCPYLKKPGCARAVYELWMRIYPRDSLPYASLAAGYFNVGDDERAIAYARNAIRLDPTNSFGHGNLMGPLMALRRFEEAERASLEAIAGTDLPEWHMTRFKLAFLKKDKASMAAEKIKTLSFGSDWPWQIQIAESNIAAFQGRMKESRALRSTLKSGSVSSEDQQLQQRCYLALYDAAVIERDRAMATVSALTSVVRGRMFPARLLALAAALAEDRPAVEAIMKATEEPSDNPAMWSVARALAGIRRSDSLEMDPRRPTVRDWAYPLMYMRGVAYLRERDGRRAVDEFQRFIDQRGIDPISPFYPLAHLQQGRAYALLGEHVKARERYDVLFRLWSEADADVPIFEEAKTEYATLRK